MSTEKPSSNTPAAEQKPSPPRVPSINLEKAIDLMRKVWEYEKRNTAPVASILAHWGYKLKSSGGFLAIASMKRFGLLDEIGGGDKRSLKLSAFALELLKNESSNPSEFQGLLKAAALRPKFHREIWNKYGDELPSDSTLHSFLVFDNHFSEEAAKLFMREYKETIAFAKLRSADMVEELKTEENEEHGSPEQKQPATPAVLAPPLKQPPKPDRIAPPVTATLRYLPIPLDIGDAPIPVGMSEDDFTLLLDTLNLWKRRIVKPEYPKSAIWKNKDTDMPVTIVGIAGTHEGQLYYQSSTGTGIPSSEISFTAPVADLFE